MEQPVNLEALKRLKAAIENLIVATQHGTVLRALPEKSGRGSPLHVLLWRTVMYRVLSQAKPCVPLNQQLTSAGISKKGHFFIGKEEPTPDAETFRCSRTGKLSVG